MDVPWQGASINPIIWCAVGAGLGWLAAMVLPVENGGTSVKIENIAVGIFGAFAGGEFTASLLRDPIPVVKGVAPAAIPFTMSALGLAVGGAVVMLALLGLMRKIVGPMRAGKSKSADRQ